MKTNDADTSERSQREFAPVAIKQAAQRELAAGVLKQAAQDLRRFHGGASKMEREIYLDAYRWFTVDEYSSPFSFLNVCQLLNLAPEAVRLELVGDSSSGAANYCRRRCTRAVRRFQTSLGHAFVRGRNATVSMPARCDDVRRTVFPNAATLSGSYLHENFN